MGKENVLERRFWKILNDDDTLVLFYYFRLKMFSKVMKETYNPLDRPHAHEKLRKSLF